MRTSINQNCGTCAYGAHGGISCTYIPPPLIRNFIRSTFIDDLDAIRGETKLSSTEPDNYCTEWRSKAEFRDPVEVEDSQ